MRQKVTEFSFEGQNIYAGIDVHKKSWAVTIITDNSLTKTFSQDPDAAILRAYLERNFPKAKYFSAYEAGFCGFSVHRKLTEYGIENIIVNAADIPTTDKERKQKEDRRDSQKIARCLKNNELTGIYILEKDLDELRSLVRYRKTITKEIARHKNRIKSHLNYLGVAIPTELSNVSKYWSGRFTQWLESIELSTVHGDMVLQGTLATVKHLKSELLRISRKFRSLEKEGKYAPKIKLLRSVPGVGLIVAITLLSELVTIKRFKDLDRLCSFVGLVPRTNSSGEKERAGRISRRSNRHLKSMIIESAWIASRNDPALAKCYLDLCKRMQGNKAIIRIAKKLLSRIRYVMKNEQEYKYCVM